MDVSIIIVNYNTCGLLKDCLESIFRHTAGIEFEVIVSDNGSDDGSLQMVRAEFPRVVLVENDANLGFGAANNRGLAAATGKYIFYLNSDTVLLNNAVKLFHDYWENSPDKDSLGALGCNLVDAEGNVAHSHGEFAGYRIAVRQLVEMFFSNMILSVLFALHIEADRFRRSAPRQKKLGEVDYVTGADLFLLNDSLAQFDEDFFLYFEEADLQKRLEENRRKRILIDGPAIRHLCGGSVEGGFSIRRKSSFSRIQFELSRIKFLKKHFSKTLLPVPKALVTLIWLNPFLFANTRKYIRDLWKI